eukprot:519237_1
MTYEWNPIGEHLKIMLLLFRYSTICTDIKPLIDDIGNTYKIHEFNDRTRDKSDILYNKTKQLIYKERNQTLFKQLKFEIETEYETKLTSYLKSSDFATTLLDKINSKSIGHGLQFNAIYVTTEKIPDYAGVIVGCIIGGIVGLFCLCICYKNIHSKYLQESWFKSPTVWVNNNGISGEKHEGEANPFIDGMYNGHYCQYRQRYIMYDFKLIFHDSNVVTGSGTDTVGDYNIEGLYSVNTARMQLNKRYIEGTGDLNENLGHTVKIKLEWSSSKQQFAGPWYVKTHKYEGTGKWIIKRSGDINTSGDHSQTSGLKKNKHNGNEYVSVYIDHDGQLKY